MSRSRDVGFRSITAGDAASLGSMSASENNDLAYNLMIGGHATHNFGSDLTTRLDFRYTYEDQESNNVGGSGNTLTLGGLWDLDNATTSLNPDYGRSSQRANAGIGRRQHRLQGSLFLRRLAAQRRQLAVRRRPALSQLLSRVARVVGCRDEPWFKGTNIVDQLKFRAAVGTAGGASELLRAVRSVDDRHRRIDHRQHARQQNLRPENTLETEYGIDAELFHKYGLNITYARDITTDQLLLVPASVSSGFSNQWRNAGTMDGRTWEVSLNVPIITQQEPRVDEPPQLGSEPRVHHEARRSRVLQLEHRSFRGR